MPEDPHWHVLEDSLFQHSFEVLRKGVQGQLNLLRSHRRGFARSFVVPSETVKSEAISSAIRKRLARDRGVGTRAGEGGREERAGAAESVKSDKRRTRASHFGEERAPVG
jgi:hypothetical protein